METTPAEICTAIQWSADSELLAAVIEAPDSHRLQIWRRSNWHWDLKHEMHFSYAKAWAQSEHALNCECQCDCVGPTAPMQCAAAVQVLHIEWDREKGNVLRAFTSSGELHCFHYTLTNHISMLGTAAVMDGSQLRVTPLRCALKPQ